MKVETTKPIIDPIKYMEMRQPFTCREEAEAAIDEFTERIKSARTACRITDLYLVGMVAWTEGESVFAEHVFTEQFGDANSAELLLNAALEVEQTARAEHINQALE